MFKMKLRILPIGFFWLSITWSVTVTAAYVCPNGPGPGEVMVGMSPGGGNTGIGQFPMCESRGESQQEDVPESPKINHIPPPKADSFVAVAWHEDANDVWAIWNNRSETDAKKRVLDACNKVMGNDCSYANGGKNSSVAVSRYTNGVLAETVWGETPDKAKENALIKCSKQGQKCKVDQVFTALFLPDYGDDPSLEYFPNKKVGRLAYAMVAWLKPDSNLKQQGKTWLASGKGYHELRQHLLNRCKQDNGFECEIGITVPNGVIASYTVKPSNVEMFVGALTREDAEVIINNRCAKEKWVCNLGKFYDSKTPRLEVLSQPK